MSESLTNMIFFILGLTLKETIQITIHRWRRRRDVLSLYKELLESGRITKDDIRRIEAMK